MSPQRGGFNSSAVETITEFTETTRLTYLSGATVYAKISTPLNTIAHGDILFIDVSGGVFDQIFLGAILVSLGILVCTTIIERRMISGSKRPKKLRRKTK